MQILLKIKLNKRRQRKLAVAVRVTTFKHEIQEFKPRMQIIGCGDFEKEKGSEMKIMELIFLTLVGEGF